MSKYQKELDQIKPSNALLEETLRKVHEETARFHAETTHKKVAFGQVAPKFNWRIAVAAAACLGALAGGVWLFHTASVPVTNMSASTKPVSVSVAYRGRQDVTESVSSVAEYSKRCSIDFPDLFAGFSLNDASIEIYSDAQNSVIGDSGVLSYVDGDRKITLYVSSTDQIAPEALLSGESRQIGETQVWFGISDDGKTLYAAWLQNGPALCAQSTGMRLSLFINCVKSALKPQA